jgi:hypothetical protein
MGRPDASDTSEGVGLFVQRLDAHLLHQRRTMLAVNRKAFSIEYVAEYPGAGKRMLEMQFVDVAYQHRIGLTGRLRSVVRRRACRRQNGASRGHCSSWVQSIISWRSAIPPW